MELEDCLRGRRSVRTYKNEPVPADKIESILEAGVWAATGMNRQPWRFIVIEDKNVIRFVSDEAKKAVRETMPVIAKRFETDEDVICYNAPVLILMCAEVDKTFGGIYLRDSVLAAQNMFLKAHELGLGTCYMGWIDLMNQSHPEVLKKAGVPDGYDMKVALILGYPKGKLGVGKREKPKIVKWVR